MDKDIQSSMGDPVPVNVISASNTASNDQYLRLCRENEVKPHPARFPRALPEFAINLCTEENDIVLDPFAGSNMTGHTAEGLGRHWIALEQNEEYLQGATFRFADVKITVAQPRTTRKPRTPSITPVGQQQALKGFE